MKRVSNIPLPVIVTALVFTALSISFILADEHIVNDLNNMDTGLLIWVNSHQFHFIDHLMLHVGNLYFWVPFYCFLLLVVLAYDKVRFKRMLPFLILYLGLQALFLLAFNIVFEHLRPLYEQHLSLQLHTGSAHKGIMYGCIPWASTAVGTALFLNLYLQHRYWLPKLLLVCWTIMVLYSRVYNGFNYPSEILFGALMGLVLSFFSFMAYKKKLNRYYGG